MIKYDFEFLVGRNYYTKSFTERQYAFAYGVQIRADKMREICKVMPNEWEKPSVLAELYQEYKREQWN